MEMDTVKTRFIKDVKEYFGDIKDPKHYHANSTNYDIDLITGINGRIKNGNNK